MCRRPALLWVIYYIDYLAQHDKGHRYKIISKLVFKDPLAVLFYIIKRNIFPHTSQPGQSILRCDGARLRSSLVDCLTNDHIIPQFCGRFTTM